MREQDIVALKELATTVGDLKKALDTSVDSLKKIAADVTLVKSFSLGTLEGTRTRACACSYTSSPNPGVPYALSLCTRALELSVQTHANVHP